MSDRTAIEWTEASWNPVRGCSVVSPGCKNCYAMKMAHRFSGKGGVYEGLTKMSKGGPVWTGAARTVPELLDAPLHWKKPRRIFVNSMSDLFHEDVPTDFIAQVFVVMAEAKRHTFQILTKRAERMQQLLAHDLNYEGPEWPLPNVWLGVSVEDQVRADERIPLLLQTPAAVRFVSYEPALGPVDWSRFHGLNWIIIGGESGAQARRFDWEWARSTIAQCRQIGAAPFMKQTGTDYTALYERVQKDRNGADPAEWPQDLRIREYPA